MIKMNCKRCGHKWEYKGKKKIEEYPTYTICPKCRTTLRLVGEENLEKEFRAYLKKISKEDLEKIKGIINSF